MRISIPGVLLVATVGKGGFLRPGRYPADCPPIAIIHDKNVLPQSVMQVTGEQYCES